MPRIATRDMGPITAPFSILVDKREKKPYAFSGLKADAKEGARPIQVPLEFGFLANGDYSIAGHAERVGVERKSKEDLFASVRRRQNFEERLARMTEIRERLGWRQSYFAVVVEADLQEIRTNPPRFSRLHPKSLNRTILSWRQLYAVDWYFLPDRIQAEFFSYRILERYWKNFHRRTDREKA